MIFVAPVKGKAEVMGRHKDDDGFLDRECCICGRVFLPAVQHIFRISGKWCCTYPCYLKLQANIEAQRAADRERQRAARKAKKQTSGKTEGEKYGD